MFDEGSSSRDEHFELFLVDYCSNILHQSLRPEREVEKADGPGAMEKPIVWQVLLDA